MKRRAFLLLSVLLATSIAMVRSLFKSPLAPDTESFRDRVLKIARSCYPGVSFEAPPTEPDVIIANEIQLGLQNLKAKFDQSDRSQRTLEDLVAKHFGLALQSRPSGQDFEAAKPKLKPQLMPPNYATLAPIISFPFGRTLAIGIAVDADKDYIYLKREDALRWHKSHEELLDFAIANLDAATHNLPLQAGDNEEAKWVGVETKDGFDAARILIPSFREFLAARLGSPFCFGIPNRDFLICWNSGASARFTSLTASKIQKDFETQPYPLSPNVFETAADGTVTERASA